MAALEHINSIKITCLHLSLVIESCLKVDCLNLIIKIKSETSFIFSMNAAGGPGRRQAGAAPLCGTRGCSVGSTRDSLDLGRSTTQRIRTLPSSTVHSRQITAE